MTVSEIISLIRTGIKEHSDDTYYEDQYLWELFLIEKADILSKHEDKSRFIDPHNYIKFCMELEKAKSHECGCLAIGCDVLKTKNKLPRFITSKQRSLMRLYDLSNRTIQTIDEWDYDNLKVHPVYSKKTLASIVNSNVVLWNNLDKKVIQISGIPEDILDVGDVQYCNPNDPTAPECIDVYNTDIGLEKKLIKGAVNEVFRALGIPKQLREDLLNDANPELNVQ